MNISIKHTEPATFKPIENELITIKHNQTNQLLFRSDRALHHLKLAAFAIHLEHAYTLHPAPAEEHRCVGQ